MKTVRINNWKCTPYSDAYQAPEIVRMRLEGEVYGHPEHKDGTYLKTSYIVASKGMTVKTASGTYYELDAPDEEYLKWCQENNIVIDPEWPIKVGEGEKWFELPEDLTIGVN